MTPTQQVSVSFEFFPPKTAEMEAQLWSAIARLAPLKPAFVSVTYGAGGSTRDRTHATVKRIIEDTDLKPAAHLTCVGATREEIDDVAQEYWSAGVRHIVALRGDPQQASARYIAHDAGYQSTPEMIAGIRKVAPFEISVSAYPEKHPDSPSLAFDAELLKKKIDAGAGRAITQFVFDAEKLARFRDAMRNLGISIPIVPGLMPTTNFAGVKRMAERCGATVPSSLARKYEGLDDNLEARKRVAAAILLEQVMSLRKLGFEQFHFYTLNQADLAYDVCTKLGLEPPKVSAA
ncbi:MAG TPA: methylenetetrahydrofolate reductase [NAD(P)H] [Rhizomicrobium sp.]|nr:methylenetetrahydrofolate reductase [NAD(P)H] [Rhizomicrobium sp.]